PRSRPRAIPSRSVPTCALRAKTIPGDCECLCKSRVAKAARSQRLSQPAFAARNKGLQQRSTTARSTTNKSSFRTYNREPRFTQIFTDCFNQEPRNPGNGSKKL